MANIDKKLGQNGKHQYGQHGNYSHHHQHNHHQHNNRNPQNKAHHHHVHNAQNGHGNNSNNTNNNKSKQQQQQQQQTQTNNNKKEIIRNKASQSDESKDKIASLNVHSTGFALSSKMSLKDFELKKLIGKGSFGKVWQVRELSTNKIYALKILKKKELVARKQVIHTKAERRILANITHPFLVSLRYAFQTDLKLFMVMDFFNGGELFFHLQKCGKFTEKRSRFYAAEMCLAIECLHSHNIIYRDLKPENILLDCSGHIKITDFGLSKESITDNGSALTHTFCGSPEYLAPEMLQQNGYNNMVDWWSFGTLLYEMICGLPPFYDQNIQKMYQSILYQQVPFYKFMSTASIDLISCLLKKNPLKRISAKSIKRHQFFKSIDWIKLYNKQIEPPFKPNVMNETDTSNFQTNNFVKSATPSHKSESIMAAKDQFPQFTYDGTTDKNTLNE